LTIAASTLILAEQIYRVAVKNPEEIKPPAAGKFYKKEEVIQYGS
jgi:hypothetical protein